MTPQSSTPETNTLVVEYWPNRRWRWMNNLAGVVICAGLWWTPHGPNWLRIPVTILIALSTLVRIQTRINLREARLERVFALFGRWAIVRGKSFRLDAFHSVFCEYVWNSRSEHAPRWVVRLDGQDGQRLKLQERKENPHTHSARIVEDSRTLAGQLGLGFQIAGPVERVGIEATDSQSPGQNQEKTSK